TGSGKTTTLYSFIANANDPSSKVITCEDPVEYVMDGIVQCSVNPKTGPTFADSLRAIVRQDPDTIVVGEIRDQATAHLAAEAALTGHKVYSTFHTEDAVGAFVRFLEMGVEPFLVASTLSAVVAQRLVRRLCPNCRVPHRPSTAELRFLGLDREEFQGVALLHGKGCEQCSGTGFKGRLAIHEVLVPDDKFREAVLRRASSSVLRELARSRPEFLTMQEDGVLKAISGVTTLFEIIENAPRDTHPRSLDELRRISLARS
ncbi:MAG: ATPase, T2SS/T4P/T4SS family, partial [Gemmatimonadaceae bacterium]